MKKVVTITGGTGGFALLSGLKNKKVNLKCIVNVADDGGSTGDLMKELNIIPPGDIRQCIIALSQFPTEISSSLNYRFKKGPLKGHALGNIFLAGLEKNYQDIEKGLGIISKIFKLKGEIIPASLKPTTLSVKLESGEVIKGESTINKSKKLSKKGIKQIYINKNNQANKKALEAVKNADILIIGPGNLYCSLIPTLLINGVSRAIDDSKAKIFYISSIINKQGHTDNFKVDDYAKTINNYLGKNKINYVLANNVFLNNEFVEITDDEEKHSYRLTKKPLLLNKKINYDNLDKISKLRSPVIHDGEKLVKTILKIYNKNN